MRHPPPSRIKGGLRSGEAAVPLGIPGAMILSFPALLPLFLGISACQSWPSQEGIKIIPNIIHNQIQKDQSGDIQVALENQEGGNDMEVLKSLRNLQRFSIAEAAIIRSLRSNKVYHSSVLRNMKRNGDDFKN